MSGNENPFECLRCGRCCSSLLAEDGGVLRGLTLLPGEHERFPPSTVKPALGIGRSPHESGFRIAVYQLTEDACLHLEEGSCGIYSERPTSCRQFPFSLRHGPDGTLQMGFDLNCPALLALIEDTPRPGLGSDARRHAQKLLDTEHEARRDQKRAWYFDLGSEKWVRYSEIMEG